MTTSFRYPFMAQIASLPPEVQEVHVNAWNKMESLSQAIAVQASKINAVAGTTTTNVTNTTESVTNAGVSSFNGMSGAVTFFSTLGSRSDRTGLTAYTTQSSDNGALIIVNDASPVAVTLNSTVIPPYFFFITNLGAGTATLTPTTGTINGGASFTLPQNYTAVVIFAGAVWSASVLPVVPISTTAIAGEFLTGYDATTGLFTQAAPTGLSVTITTAALTTLGAQGSMTYTHGILTAQVQAT